MASKHSSELAQARRRHWLALLYLIETVSVFVLAACGAGGSAGGSSSGSSPTLSPTPTTNPYRQFDQDVARLLVRRAVWQAPKRIQVDQTARVGLIIGDPGLLNTQIAQLVPEAYPKPAGSVKVGSTISVQLQSDPNDASVTPNDAVDESMGEHTALLWTWYVNAKHPNSGGLLLTAEINTEMSDGHVWHQELALSIPVDRTVQYTLYQVFSNWATWAAIVAALVTALGWVWRRHKKPKDKNALGDSSVTT